jgi:hypothetical protein
VVFIASFVPAVVGFGGLYLLSAFSGNDLDQPSAFVIAFAAAAYYWLAQYGLLKAIRSTKS